MSAAIPIDSKGRKCQSNDTLILATEITAAQKAAITTFPNGHPLPANTGIDNWWRFKTQSGIVAADGTMIAFITPAPGQLWGYLMSAFLKNSGKSWVDQNADVVSYRSFLELHTGSPQDAISAQGWLDLANAIAASQGYPPNIYTQANINADINAAKNIPWFNQSQDTL